ncbi:acyl-CoA ligase FadD31 [Mycobacteroides abscessus subsp. abscessus]|nr:acyl-CoA ligase FadD31 [Mycobacteroides abscessus subsp. abscessus]
MHVGRDTALRIEDYLDADGHIALPGGITLLSFLDRNIAQWAHSPAFRYLDYTHDDQARVVELTWSQLGSRLRAVGARLQQVTQPGDRVAIAAPHGVDYVVGFFSAIRAGTIAVPLFAPELPGHAERLNAVLTDAQPAVVLTTTAAAEHVVAPVRKLPRVRQPRVIAVDAVPDAVGATFAPVPLDTDDIAYLQYTSGSTGTPAGVKISHRAVCTNIVQMIISVGLDWDIRSISWLPLYHDMGLLMIMFPVLFGGQITLMSPMAFVRRPHRWIKELAAQSVHGRTFAAAPNFAFELAAQRGLPPDGEELDLSNVAGLINGAEPVSISSIDKFNAAFARYNLPATAVKPSYGMAEATLFISTIDPTARATAIHLDRRHLREGHAVRVAPDHLHAVAHVSCGHVARSLWATITDPDSGAELPDGDVGEIWLHGDNVGSGYWGRGRDSELAFGNKLQSRTEYGSRAEGVPDAARWFRTGDLGVFLDGELYIIGRIKDLIIIDGRNHYPEDIEATAAQACAAVRPGFIAAFSVPAGALAAPACGPGEQVVIVAERAPGAGRADPHPISTAIRAAVSRRHGLNVADVVLVAAGAIPRTTSGKIARRACRADYLDGKLCVR